MKMKKYFLLALVVWTGIASSCKYDDDEVWDSVNNLADRVTALEAATKQINSDIAALQSIVSALQKQVSVTSVEELADGYIIHFSDGTDATIKNGADGKDGANGADGKDGVDGADGKDGANAPIINVAAEDGIYYWTITVDGKTDWLTDEEGNKMRVTGEDGEDGKDGTSGSSGKNGKTPLLKVDGEGYWIVSYDNWDSYDYVYDEENNKVKAKGADADSFFKSIKKEGDVVIVELADNEEYSIPMEASVKYTGEAISDNVLTLTKGSNVELTFEVSGMTNASAEVVKKDEGISWSVTGNKLTFKLTADSIKDDKIVILFYNANQTITSVLKVEIEE